MEKGRKMELFPLCNRRKIIGEMMNEIYKTFYFDDSYIINKCRLF